MTLAEELNSLYETYKHSVPTRGYTKQKRKHKPYFKAMDYEELEDDDFIFGENRYDAQKDLENRVFNLTEDEKNELFSDGNWFWQGEDKDFIIVKSWLK